MIYDVSTEQLQKLFKGLNLKDRVILLNIRAKSKDSNQFDDTTHLVVNDQVIVSAESTCDPGISNLLVPVNPNGTAIVMNGYYKDLWTNGYHKGKYKAFTQNRPVIVFRDNDKDRYLDYIDIHNDDPAVTALNFTNGKATLVVNGVSYVLERGMFGINCHRASETKIVKDVNLYSAGCCVVQDAVKFQRLLVNAKVYQNSNVSCSYDAYYTTIDKLESLK